MCAHLSQAYRASGNRPGVAHLLLPPHPPRDPPRRRRQPDGREDRRHPSGRRERRRLRPPPPVRSIVERDCLENRRDVWGPRFGGAQRQLGACSAPLSHLWGPVLGPASIYQTVSRRGLLRSLYLTLDIVAKHSPHRARSVTMRPHPQPRNVGRPHKVAGPRIVRRRGVLADELGPRPLEVAEDF